MPVSNLMIYLMRKHGTDPTSPKVDLLDAILGGNTHMAIQALDRMEDIRAESERGTGFLVHACHRDRDRIFLELVKRGLNPYDALPCGSTLLHTCVQFRSLRCARVLIELGVYVDEFDQYRNTALGLACRLPAGGVELVRMLLDAGADPSLISSVCAREPEVGAMIREASSKWMKRVKHGDIISV